jgi:hypothetical protein
MRPSIVLRRVLQLCSILFLVTLLPVLTPSHAAYGQGLELGGGWTHLTGFGGTDGFGVDGGWWFTKRVTLAVNYDDTWDNQLLGTFAFTAIGGTAVKSHLQNLITGPRIFFTNDWTTRHKLNPFGEAQFGVSWLGQTIIQTNIGEFSASGNAFTWELGGGAEYLFSPHWSARANLDLLRTHFIDEGQSHLRLAVAVVYTFGSRGESK